MERELLRRQRELAEKGLPMVWLLTDTGESIAVGDGNGPEVSGHSADLVWWLLGRGSGGGLVTERSSLPDLGRWA